MAIYSKGLLIGRFQPFHRGHLYLIRHVQKKVRKLVIAIGSANVFDEDNPFTYEERKKMIEKVIKEEKLNSFIEKIIPLNDFYDDEVWFKTTIHKTGAIDRARGGVDVIVGNNEWPNRIFEDRGYKIWRVGFFKKYLYEGEKIRRLIHHKKSWVDRVPSYLFSFIDSLIKHHKHIPYRFQHIALGGTFDHFHKGHKKIIDTALRYGKNISLGITTEEMYKNKKFSSSIEPFQIRKQSVIRYLAKQNASKRVTFLPLSDIYGSAAYDGTIEVLVVSRSTYPNAIKINKLREKKSLPEVKIICIKDVKATDGRLISSERIRKGDIDRQGKSYMLHVTSYKNNLILPEYLREELRRPLGKVIRGKENELEKTVHKVIKFIKFIKPTMVIAVGDIIANSLEKAGFIPDVKIIDYRSRRQAIQKPKKLGKMYVNKPGTISKEAVSAIKSSFSRVARDSKDKQTIVVDGEEDLLALPAILFAPLGSVVLYGQIDLGVVLVKVTEELKKNITQILHKFEEKLS